MTADQTRSAEGTDIPKDGASVRFKMFNAVGVVVTRTVETPPRLVVRTADAAGPFDYVAAIAEVEVIKKQQTPFEKITGGVLADFWKAWATSAIQHALPKQSKPEATGRDLDGQFVGPTDPPSATAFGWVRSDLPDALEMSSDRRFYVTKNIQCGHYHAYDGITRTISWHFRTIEQAKKWCEDRAKPAPKLKSAPGIEWNRANRFDATDSKCKRFRFYPEVNPAGGISYRAADNWVKHSYTSGPADQSHRYSPLGTISDVKEWCEDRNEWNVNNTNGVSRLEDKSIPF